MKKIIILFVSMSAFIFSLGSYAESGEGGERGKGKRPDFSQLNLSDVQKEKFKSLMEKHREEHQQLKETNSEKDRETHKALKILHEQHKTEMQKLLSEEQFEKFEQVMKKRRKFRKQKRKESVDQ